MKNKINSAFILGIIILIIALFYMLNIFGIDFRHFIILVIGIALSVYAIKNDVAFFKYFSAFLIVDGVLHIISVLPFFNPDNILLHYLSGLIVLLIVFYFISKKKTFILAAAGILFILSVIYIDSLALNTNVRYAYYIYSFAILSVIYYIIRSEKTGYKPLLISFIAYLFGTNHMLLGNNIITTMNYKFINLLLLIFSAVCILLISKNKNISKENESER